MMDRPGFLWLLVLLPFVVLAARRTLVQWTPAQRAVSLALRALLFTLVIFALAGPRIPWRSKEVAVVFAFDRSASVTPEAEAAGRAYIAEALKARRSGDSAALLSFDGGVATLPLPDTTSPGWPAKAADRPETNATDIGKALRFGSALFPDGKSRRLVLLSDGYDTVGQGLRAAKELQASGVELVTIPLRNAERPEVLVAQLAIPPELKKGEPFNAVATLHSNIDGDTCTAVLHADGFKVAEQTVALRRGSNTVTFPNLRAASERSTYRVEIAPSRDTVAENNHAESGAFQMGTPRVLLVDSHEERLQPLRTALLAENIAAVVRPAGGLPRTMDELRQFDALFLSDVPAMRLSREQMQLYSRWVKEFGGGFAMIGGEQSFGVGGYFQTPIEALLPVSTDHDDRMDTPSVAMVIILDSSGSMNAQVAGQTKMSLANQGAAMALSVLQPQDLLGVMAVDTRVHPVVPLMKHANKAEVSQNILRVAAGGGGIYVYTSLLEAYAQLRDQNAKIKHIILFSDAADAEEKAAGEMPDGSRVPGTALDLASAMTAARITTSVVALGSNTDRDVSFLRQLAQNGAGRFYLTSDALTLPQIFTTETMRVSQSSLSEEPIAAVPVRKAGAVEGIAWGEAPLLLGYNITKLKPTADLVLSTETGDPLLATWQYGLGRVAAFTSDAKSRWASEWLGWPGYGKFWAQLTRSLLRRSGHGSGLQVTLHPEPGGMARLEIDAVTPEGEYRNELPLSVAVERPDEPLEHVEALQTAPGHYRARVRVGTTGTTRLQVHSPAIPEGGPMVGYTAPYPPEFLNNDTNESALQQLADAAGGRMAPAPESLFAPPAVGIPRGTSLAPWLLAAALLLLPLDIWTKRSA